MSIKVVLFDLDGTLLPMEQEVFVKSYFGLLAKKLAPYGYDSEKLIPAIWKGTGAMVQNDGRRSNEEVFWETFAAAYSARVKEDIALFDEFYRKEFVGAKEVCGYHPMAAKAVYKIKEMGFRVGLATNPLFPQIATENRIRWAGLLPEDFEFYTTYETSRFCKPNVKYYEDIVKQLAVSADECLMVGNDVAEDMIAETLGMKVFLLTDCLINKEQKDISIYPHGSFEELLAYIEGIDTLPSGML